MPRHRLRAFTAGLPLLIGLAASLAASGCAAVPAINLASSYLRPAQPGPSAAPAPAATTAPGATTQATAGAPSTDFFAGIAQRLGVTLPVQQPAPTAATAAPTATLASTTPAATPASR